MNIPVLHVNGESLAEVWEKSLVEVYSKGVDIKTQYDKPEDPPSKDCTMVMTINSPLSEPMIHKDFPGGLEDLQEYVMEVLDGIKNHLVRDPNDPTDTRWEYTYNQRLFEYSLGNSGMPKGWLLADDLIKKFDQIETICQKIAKTPYTRRAQAITWKVWEDNDCYDPACLQSVWCRCLEDEEGLTLNMNVRFRSNDCYKASFMNMFALIMLQKKIADRVSELSGKKVMVGRYCHIADSYHIYGSYFEEFKNRFIKNLSARTFEERVFNYADVKFIMDESIPAILKKAKEMK